jgi:hypothetical protein
MGAKAPRVRRSGSPSTARLSATLPGPLLSQRSRRRCRQRHPQRRRVQPSPRSRLAENDFARRPPCATPGLRNSALQTGFLTGDEGSYTLTEDGVLPFASLTRIAICWAPNTFIPVPMPARPRDECCARRRASRKGFGRIRFGHGALLPCGALWQVPVVSAAGRHALTLPLRLSVNGYPARLAPLRRALHSVPSERRVTE